MTAALSIVGGDEVLEPFLLEGSDGLILDISDLTITAEVWWRETPKLFLTVENGGIEITNTLPVRADDAADQDPHGNFRLTESETLQIPEGQVASLRLKAVQSGDVLTSSYLVPINRVP